MSAFCALVVHGSASGKASIVIRAVPFRSIGQTVRANERRPEQTIAAAVFRVVVAGRSALTCVDLTDLLSKHPQS